jgi:hypothetical protein
MTDKGGTEMNTVPYGPPEQEEWDAREEEPLALAPRARRRGGGPLLAAVLASLVGAIGFYVGIRVEKGQLSSTSTTGATGAASRLAALAGRGSAAGAGAGGGGFARAFAGGGAGGNSTVGTISSVDGRALYLTDTSGNTIKVALSSVTTITKSLGVSTRSVHPGDTVIVSGLKGSGGTISATTVNDTGARSAGGGTGSSSGSGSASSAVSSLFGSGSGG